uniref:type II toxin-antitoxin system VapB family antitoxin n=1 Tax=Sphingomonas populi TaxID=2484750 RepID=UPI0013EE916A|nr:type II toxin-antitoxin system VapB family antitoxin [Sphingomonas populi]
MATQLNIKSPEARRLAEALAEESGQSITQVVTDALRQRLTAVRRERARTPDAMRKRELQFYDIVEGSRERWRGGMTAKDYDDLLYDEHGLPR